MITRNFRQQNLLNYSSGFSENLFEIKRHTSLERHIRGDFVMVHSRAASGIA